MKTRNEQIREIERLLAQYDRKFSRAFMEGIAFIQDRITLKEIAGHLEARNPSAVMAIFNEALVAAGMVTFARTLQSAMIDGGDLGARIASASRVEFGFNIAENKTAQFLRDYQAERIRQITQEMRQTITQVIFREASTGTNPIETARKIRANLGLTASQEVHVENYRRYLTEGNRRALENKLRDARYDPTVARSLKIGKPLKADQIDRMVDRYRQRYILRRSETIARTESMTMIHTGQNDFWRQLSESGQVAEKEIRREWIVTRDSRLRDAHAAIPGLNKTGVGLNESFRSPLGMIRFPGDPAASAANRINCRCSIFHRIVKE